MIYLIRHATAGVRDRTDPADAARPLDDFGRTQADWIAHHLADATIDGVYSSPALRCRQTVEPLASDHGLFVQTSEALAEGNSIATAMGFIRQCGDHSAFCLHGDLLPEIVQALHNAGMYSSDSSEFSKGVVWSIELDEDSRPGAARCNAAPSKSKIA